MAGKEEKKAEKKERKAKKEAKKKAKKEAKKEKKERKRKRSESIPQESDFTGLTQPLNESKKRKKIDNPILGSNPLANVLGAWLDANTTMEFRAKHIAFDEGSGVKIRQGAVGSSTVLILDSKSNLDSILNLKLKKSMDHTLSVDNMIISGTTTWQRGSGTVTLRTNGEGQLYHLHASKMANVLETKPVFKGRKTKF